MTSPTGPDRDRLRASDAGQDDAEQDDDCGLCYIGQRCPGYCAAEGVGSLYDRPAPQQPPAQEQENFPVHQWSGDGDEEHCTVCGTRAPADDVECFGPPSEADSAGEDEAELDAATAWVSHHVSPAIGWWRLADSESKTFDHQLMQDRYRAAAAQVLAMRPPASSGVRGGDDQARERLADVLALHVPWYEIDGVRHDNLVTIGCGSYKGCDGNDQFWCTEADEHPHEVPACYECRCVIDGDLEGHLLWPCPTVRAAGGGR